ncbi:hypothetical protein ElyMa_003546800 [Elysia marginata]|uniref:PiggyBac transposable element-derived protein domain-containing protein n=1 Tax=Elysia marginata TaxID=1093978 RepID=A0AAV4EL77_9GAST|nr:hypothetical protein ElyMa_003546800 [Elysia marginata]
MEDTHLTRKLQLYTSIVDPTILFGYKTWTLKTAFETMIQAFYNKCMRRLLQFFWAEELIDMFGDVLKHCWTTRTSPVIAKRQNYCGLGTEHVTSAECSKQS